MITTLLGFGVGVLISTFMLKRYYKEEIEALSRELFTAGTSNKIQSILDQQKREIVEDFVKYITTPLEFTDSGVKTNKITYDGIKFRAEQYLNNLK